MKKSNRQEEDTCFINPSKSSIVRQVSLHSPSVRRSSGVSVPRTAITTDLVSCRTTMKYAAWHFPWYITNRSLAVHKQIHNPMTAYNVNAEDWKQVLRYTPSVS